MNYFYIYNLYQADYFIKHKVSPIEIGRGNKNHIYIKFVRDLDSEQVFKMWVNHEK